MAAYYDYIPGAVQFRTPALDPSNEVGTFLSYKLTDWCNKIGPNYAQIWTNHEEWEASDRYVNGSMTSTDLARIELRLLGRDYRAGTFDGTGIEAWNGIQFNREVTNRRFQFQIINQPTRIDPLGGYERNNLVRNSYGQINSANYLDLGTTNYVWDNDDFAIPKITRVLYSDTPGQRYFAWMINNNPGQWMTGIIYEYLPRADYPAGIDPGWAITTGYQWYNLPTWNPSNLGNYRNYYKSRASYVEQDYALGDSQNNTYATVTMSSASIIDYHGDLVGVAKNFYYGSGIFSRDFTYRINGKKYFAWDNNTLLPVD